MDARKTYLNPRNDKIKDSTASEILPPQTQTRADDTSKTSNCVHKNEREDLPGLSATQIGIFFQLRALGRPVVPAPLAARLLGAI